MIVTHHREKLINVIIYFAKNTKYCGKTKILLAICLVFLFATFSFAGDFIFAPVISKPAPGEMDIYIVTNDRGRTETIAVVDLGEDTYVAVDSNGKSTYIMKMDD